MKRTLPIVLVAVGLLCAGRWLLFFVANAQGNPVATLNGDTNGDGVRDLSDAVRLLNWLFLGGPEPVAIAGSAGLEDRVRALEDEVGRLAESSSSPEAVLAKAVGDLKRLSTGSEDTWDFPLQTMKSAGASAAATLTLGGGKASGKVLAFRLVEGVSLSPRLDIIEEIPIPSYAAIPLGSPLKLVYEDGAGQAIFHGEVGEVSVAGVDGKNVYLRIGGFAKLHRLTRGRHSRIFQGASSMEIVQRLLGESSITPEEYELVLDATPPARDYVVQYNETDLEFVMRLLSEDGIYFFYIHSTEGAKLRFGDGPSGRIPQAGEALSYPGYLVEPPPPTGPYLSALHRTSSPAVGKVTVGDYNFAKIAAVFGTASVPGVPGENYDFGVDLFDAAQLNALARRQLELEQSQTDRLEGASNAPGLRPGEVVTVAGTDASFNGKYYITSVKHRYAHGGASGGGGYYGNTFEGIPESARHRPPKVPTKPMAAGVQSAIVTGPAGQRTYTDAYGRVKVHFHWDREGSNDEHSSAWLRVAQNSVAGAPGYFLPEVGDEVLVAFEHGDIDRPVVLGSLWNGKDRPPAN